MSFLDYFLFRRRKRQKPASEAEKPSAGATVKFNRVPVPQERDRILVADDQPAILDALKLLLGSAGFQVDAVDSPEAIMESIVRREYDAVLLDLNYAPEATSGQEGIELLEKIHAIDSQLPVIVTSAWGTIELAVQAVRRGARDFIQKPWNNESLLTTVRSLADLRHALRVGQRLEEENRLQGNHGRPLFIAEAAAMRSVRDSIAHVGPSHANVLITGEHGTGKEVVARMLHVLSPRGERPLITVNIGGLPEATFESELFGHVQGAFTDTSEDRIGRFEMADTGTLFLDEIANVPVRLQARLLRALETGEVERVGSPQLRPVNVRVLSATNADLQAACVSGDFREDLLFRLNTVEIHLPPLRERLEDIPALSSSFLSRYSFRYNKQIAGFSQDTLRILTEYTWPGNVRELEHAVERAVIMCRENVIQSHHLGLLHLKRPLSQDLSEMSLEKVEALLIGKALARCGGNISQAAETLGLSRGTFYRRMEKYGLYSPDHPRKEFRTEYGDGSED